MKIQGPEISTISKLKKKQKNITCITIRLFNNPTRSSHIIYGFQGTNWKKADNEKMHTHIWWLYKQKWMDRVTEWHFLKDPFSSAFFLKW